MHAFGWTGQENIIPTCRSAGNYYILPSKPVALKYVTVYPAKVGNALTDAARNLVKFLITCEI